MTSTPNTDKFHDDQIEVWAQELVADLNTHEHLHEPSCSDDVIHLHKVIADKLKDIRECLSADTERQILEHTNADKTAVNVSASISSIEDNLKRVTSGPWYPAHIGDPDTTCECCSICCEGYAGAVATVHVDNGKLVSDGGNDAPPYDEAVANSRHIALCSPTNMLSIVESHKAQEAALKEIANGDGAYGSQAFEYKNIARKALGLPLIGEKTSALSTTGGADE